MNNLLVPKHTIKQVVIGVAVLLLTISTAYGNTGIDTSVVFNLSQIQNTDISQEIEYFKYPHKTLPEQNFNLDQWRKTLTTHDKTSPFGDRYVAAFTLINDTNEESWFVYPYGSPIEHVELAHYSGATLVNKINSGLHHDNPILFHNGGSLKIGVNEQVTVVMLFESQIFIAPIKIVVKSEKSASKQFEIENIVLILSIGVCLALSLYNCFLYFGTGSKQYLYYALSTFGFTFSWAFIFGVVSYFVPNLSLIWGAIGFSVGLYFVVLFTISFLSLNKEFSKLYLYFKALAGLSFIASVFALFSIGLGIILLSVCSLLILLSSLYFGLKRWRRGYSPARYFVFALLFVLVPNIIVNLINLNILPGFNINALLFGQLGNSFDCLLLAFALAEQVRLTNIRNAHLTHELELNVQQRTSQLSLANKKLESLILDLREANRAKTHFLASMSHEIRTPLTSIIGFTQSIKRHEVPAIKQPEVIDIIADNSSHLLGVLNDILDISKIEANKLDFENIPTPLLSIVKQIESVMHKRAQDKGIDFETKCHFPLPDVVMSDPTRLRQILFNLTNNALKFTDHGKVVLSLSLEGEVLLFKVTDTGIGMTEAQLASLFAPFQQAESSTARKYGGTGLGLSISKHLALGLGGEITAKSQINRGSEFIFTFPLKECHGAKVIENTDDYAMLKDPIVNQNQQNIDFSGARVLIADDHPDVRKLTTLLLENMNCVVTATSSGIEAIDVVAKESPFQLILLDIQMPELDGSQTLQKLRALGCKAPIIAFTANNTEQEIERYTRIGFSAFLEKPIDRDKFKQSLSYYLHANIGSKNLLTNEQQKNLTKEYYANLIPSLNKCIQAFRANDVQTQKELSHSLRGSAASFGFDLFADLFTEYEQAIMDSDQNAVQNLQAQIECLTKRYTNPPFVNICQGIINHQVSLKIFESQLLGFLDEAQEQIGLIQHAVDNKELPVIRSLVIKFSLEINKYALEGLTQHIDMIEEYLEIKSQDQSWYNKQLNMMLRKVTELKVWFSQ